MTDPKTDDIFQTGELDDEGDPLIAQKIFLPRKAFQDVTHIVTEVQKGNS